MKLLIVTQVLDKNDPILGFFHRWVEEFSKHCESIEVVCLQEGSHSLPAHVRVHSLGKEKQKRASFIYAVRFLWLVWSLRRKYEAVFVHMNVEYLMLTGVLWRLMKKRTVLWYVHGTVSLRLRVATIFANTVLTASPDSFRIKSKKVRVIGHGIDTEFFSLDAQVVRQAHALSVGRLMPVKRHDLLIRSVARAERKLRIAGDGPERVKLEKLASELGAEVEFLGGITQDRLRDEYQSAGVLLHTSKTGSLDKVVLEALACGCPVITTSNSYTNLPVIECAPEEIAQKLSMSQQLDSRALSESVASYSLAKLVKDIVGTFVSPEKR